MMGCYWAGYPSGDPDKVQSLWLNEVYSLHSHEQDQKIPSEFTAQRGQGGDTGARDRRVGASSTAHFLYPFPPFLIHNQNSLLSVLTYGDSFQGFQHAEYPEVIDWSLLLGLHKVSALCRRAYNRLACLLQGTLENWTLDLWLSSQVSNSLSHPANSCIHIFRHKWLSRAW